eukprot:gi/632983793/ref/XP_007908822.1/ PREDICTED: irregular chiasm C-roughest protein-like [Callorhinchus milii]
MAKGVDELRSSFKELIMKVMNNVFPWEAKVALLKAILHDDPQQLLHIMSYIIIALLVTVTVALGFLHLCKKITSTSSLICNYECINFAHRISYQEHLPKLIKLIEERQATAVPHGHNLCLWVQNLHLFIAFCTTAGEQEYRTKTVEKLATCSESLWAETLTVLVSLTLGAASVAPIVVIEPDPDIPVADSGESIIATCLAKYAKAAASINWESPFNFSFTQSATPPAPDGTVTISSPLRLSPTREMNGKYVYCVVEHPALKTPERLDYKLNIHYMSSISITAVKTEQESLQLKCIVDANPSPIHYNWIRANDSFPKSITVQEDGIITLPRMTPDLDGLYVCKASNKVGSAKAFLYLDTGLNPNGVQRFDEILLHKPRIVAMSTPADPSSSSNLEEEKGVTDILPQKKDE